QHFRSRKTKLHHRNQAVTAGEKLCPIAVFLKKGDSFTKRSCNFVFEILSNHDAFLPLRIFQIFSARTGMSMCVTPNGARASTMAFTTAGVEPIVPASPTPLIPIGFTGDGVTVRSSSSVGRSWALGNA